MLDDGRRGLAAGAVRASWAAGYLTRPDNAHAKAGNINNGAQACRSACGAARLHRHPRRRFRADCRNSCARAGLFREGDVGIVQTPQHFINPDPLQINLSIARRLAGRAALLLRRGDGLQGCLGRRLLLRYVLGDPVRAAAGARRLPDRLGDRRLSRHAQDEGRAAIAPSISTSACRSASRRRA